MIVTAQNSDLCCPTGVAGVVATSNTICLSSFVNAPSEVVAAFGSPSSWQVAFPSKGTFCSNVQSTRAGWPCSAEAISIFMVTKAWATDNVVSGEDTHVGAPLTVAVASMAIEMIRKVDEYRKRTGERLQIRIGIGTGPVVAGVIGKKKFIYDMWGDTVNVAFRLAADASAETIVVDLMTHRRLYNRFRFEASQELEVKGKGRLQVFQLTGPLERSTAIA